ncbi:MAG TPA: response regulator [Methylomirabilota bacterium]|jgi:two-component system catabolic regulation response regulator CreB
MAPTSVLLIDDDDAIRTSLEAALQTAGFDVHSISLAAKIFDALRSATYDVIVLDLGMPQGSLQGMEALTLLRGIDAWRAVPVIILSAFGDVVNRDVTRRLGVGDVLGKPLDAEDLVRSVQRVVGARLTDRPRVEEGWLP